MKILWFDTETTGLDSKNNDILTIAGIIEIDGIVKEEFYVETQPFNYSNISEAALKVNGLTLEQIKTFISPQQAHAKLIEIFSKYIDRYNRADKFTPAGHNVRFDCDFLNSFFKKNSDKYFGSWFDYHIIDTVQLLQLMKFKGSLDIENCKLVTAAKKFGISLENAHNAMDDIKATRELFYKLIDKITVTPC